MDSEAARVVSSSRTKVTVLLSTYNHEMYIAQAISSVLTQETTFGYEIAIIEDCSTDQTRSVVLEFCRQFPNRIRPILADQNKNDNSEWMRVIATTSSDYIALLDGDDFWLSPHKLQKQVDCLDNHPEYSICCHNALAFYEDKSAPSYSFNSESQPSVSTLEDLWVGNFIAGCSAMIRRSAIAQIPDWFREIRWADWALYILAAQHGSIYYINEVMGAYRVHRRGLWSRLSERQQIESVIEFYEQMNANLAFKFDVTIKAMIAKNYQRLAINRIE